MATDFSTGDIYKEALRSLGEKRGQADNASKGPFTGLNEQGGAAYDALNNEAYVNKALTDRAFGTAGDRMETIKQRRESNLRNTLGKNERQRRNFEQSVDLAIKNYETQKEAGETIAAAQYGAAEAAALVSQSNFEKQLGLKRQQLEMDKKNSEFEHAFKLLSDRKLNEKGFQGITGIKVKKKPRPKPAFNMASVNAIIADANHAAIQSGVAALKENRLQEGYQGSSDTGGNPEIVGMTGSEYLAAHKEEYIEQYGATEFGIAQAYFWGVDTNESILEHDLTGVDSIPILVDFINNLNTNITELGMEECINQINNLMTSAQNEFNSAKAQKRNNDYPGEVGWDAVTQINPDLAKMFSYTNSDEDQEREWLGLPPTSFTSEAVWQSFSSLQQDYSPFALEERNEMLDKVDISSLSASEAFCVLAYIDSVVNPSDKNRILESGVYDTRYTVEILSAGEAIFESTKTQHEEFLIAVAATIPNQYDSPEANAIEVQLRKDESTWADLSLEDQAYFAEQKIENYQKVIDEYNRLLNYDFPGTNQKLAALDEELNNATLKLSEAANILDITGPDDPDANAEWEKCKSEVVRIETEQNNLRLEIQKAEIVQTMAEYNKLPNNSDFEVVSSIGEAKVNPSALGVYLHNEEVINKVTFAQYISSDQVYFELDNTDEYQGSAFVQIENGIMDLAVEYEIYAYMTDDEINIYNYLLAKEGTKSADDYLDFLEEILNYRQGIADAKSMEDDPVSQYLYSIIAGLDQFGSGVRQVFSSDRLPTTSVQFTSDAIYEDLADDGFKMPEFLGGKSIGQVVYNTGKNIGFEAPSTLVTLATAGAAAPVAITGRIASALLMGLSMKGNTYNWALAQGYDKTQAETYSILTGAGVAILQYASGGAMSSIGKTAGNIINKVASKIDEGLFRIASKIKITNISKAAEVYLQKELTPAFANIALSENSQLMLPSPRTIYPTLFGAVTTGILKAGPLITSNIDKNLAGMAVRQANKLNELVDNALALRPDTEAYRLARGLSTGDIPADEFNAGKLLMEYIDADGDTSFMYKPSASEGMEPLLLEANPNAVATQDVKIKVGNTAQEMQTLSDQTGLDLYNNSVNNAYLQFGQNPTNGNALAVYDASLESLDGAMAQQQAGTISLTDSQLGAINAQAEVVQARANELAVQGQTGNTYSIGEILTQTERLVTTLQALPPTIKAKIGYDGVFNALLSAQMNGSNMDLAQAALDNARAGVEAALEMDGLDAGTRSALEGLLGKIDRAGGIRDNGNNGATLKENLLLDGYSIFETKSAETANIEWANRGYDKPPIRPETEVYIVEAGDNQYVRFYNVDDNGKGNMIGRWLVKPSDIEGLTLSEIIDKYALPEPPEYICDVSLPANFVLEVSEANGLDSWGEGGGIQYDTMDGDLEIDWFTNPRKLD